MAASKRDRDRIGIDTGGTFTDILALSGGEVITAKIPSTPGDPPRAILEFLERHTELRARPGSMLGSIVHGTTVATNALLERRGARTALVTTRGFADLLDIARQDRPRLYDLYGSAPPPLAPPELRFEITERIGSGGTVILPVDAEELSLLEPRLRNAGAEAVAVCLLFSPENPAHEQRILRTLKNLNVPVVASSEILPELREYERFSTTTISAYVAPVMARYLGGLARSLRPRRLFVMDSAGGALPWQRLGNQAVRAILSGPAAGVTAAAALAARHERDVVSFDMGGTSTDVALIQAGEIPRTRGSRVSGLPIAIPVADVHTVGAGGGSQAWVDAGGALRVGPQSAGAEPGPIAYGRGGDVLTVTDAHVFLGHLPPDTRLGGEYPLANIDGVARAMEKLAGRLGISPAAAARGIVRVVEAEMERALRRVTQERGVDPRRLSLLSFGGAGGLHAVALARALRIREVLLPVAPGLFCALGALLAPIVETSARAVMALLEERMLARLGKDARGREKKQRVLLAKSLGAEFSDRDIAVERRLALRYLGQSHEIEVAWQHGEDPRQAFLEAYAARYGDAERERPIEVTAAQSRLLLPSRVRMPAVPRPATRASPRQTRVDAGAGAVDRAARVNAPCIARSTLTRGGALSGPAIIEELSGTLWLPAGARLRVAADETLLIEVGRDDHRRLRVPGASAP